MKVSGEISSQGLHFLPNRERQLKLNRRQVAENTKSVAFGKGGAFQRTKCNGGDTMQAQVQDWRELSEAASREQDPEKLIKLVEELNRALLYRELQSKRAAAAN